MEDYWEIAMSRLLEAADRKDIICGDVAMDLSYRMGKAGMRHTCALANQYDVYIPECNNSPKRVKPKKDRRGYWNTYDGEAPRETWRPEVAEAIDKYEPKRKSPQREDRRTNYDGWGGMY